MPTSPDANDPNDRDDPNDSADTNGPNNPGRNNPGNNNLGRNDPKQLMNDILTGRVTIAQLAQLEAERKAQRAAGGGTGSQSPARPGASGPRPAPQSNPKPARLVSFPVIPDAVAPQNRRAMGQRQASARQMPVGRQNVPQQGTARPAGKSAKPADARRRPVAAKPANVIPAKQGAAPAATPQAAAVLTAANQPPVQPASISQQLTRVLLSRRGLRSAWLLSEILAPPLALRPDDERKI